MARNDPSPTDEKPTLNIEDRVEDVEAMLEGLVSAAEDHDSSERSPERLLALAYMAGEMPDLVSKPGKSEAIEEILADAMAWLLPNLARIFMSAESVARFEPRAPRIYPGMSQDEIEAEFQRVETFAKDATETINHDFLVECNGEKVLRDGFYDGLLHANGVVKFWWDASPRHSFETFSGIPDDKFHRIINDPDTVEVVYHSDYPDEAALEASVSMSALMAGQAGPAAGMPAGPPVGGGGGLPQASGGSPGQPGAAPAAGPVPPMASAPGGAPFPFSGAPPAEDAAPGAIGELPGDVLGEDGFSGALGGLDPFGGFAPPPMLHDFKIKRITSHGRMRVEAVANEDFLIDPQATALDEEHCRFCAHVTKPTRSDLIREGIEPDQVWDLGGDVADENDTARRGRNSDSSTIDSNEDAAGERVEVYECYAQLDLDGDGVSEWYQIKMGGHMGAREILYHRDPNDEEGEYRPWIEPWGGMIPFADLCPDPVPHRWAGRSLFQRLRQPQRIATALSRRINDNVYQTVEPDRFVDMDRVRNKDAIFNRKLGQIIQCEGDPNTIVKDSTIPFFAKEAMPLVEEQRKTAERRTGVGDQSAGLDPDSMQNQVATAVNAMQGASALRKEDYARCFKIGVGRLYLGMLHLYVENQSRPIVRRVRDEWKQIDPRSWTVDADVNVNTGLGAGNRDRDLTMLQTIAGAQKEVLMQVAPMMGLHNPIMSITNLYETYRMACEASGMKGAERFFPELTPEVLQGINAAMAQAKQQQGQDPKAAAQAAKMQADMQAQQAKLQMDMQAQQQKAQMDAQIRAAEIQGKQAVAEAEFQHKQALEQAKMQADIERQRQQMTFDLQLQREKTAMEIQAMREKAEREIELERQKAAVQQEADERNAQMEANLRMREMEMEGQLKAYQIDQAGRQAQETNIPRPE